VSLVHADRLVAGLVFGLGALYFLAVAVDFRGIRARTVAGNEKWTRAALGDVVMPTRANMIISAVIAFGGFALLAFGAVNFFVHLF